MVLVAGNQSFLYRPAGTVYVMATDTRDRILNGLRSVLAEHGSGGVTLESVAAAAGVSKGGLLYHFPSKEALYEGILDRCETGVGAMITELTAELGPTRAYLDYSLPTEDDEGEYMTALIAAVRSGDGTGPGAPEKLVRTFTVGEAPLMEAVADPVLAQTIRLVGLGMYLSAIAGLPMPEAPVLQAVCDRLVAEAEG